MRRHTRRNPPLRCGTTSGLSPLRGLGREARARERRGSGSRSAGAWASGRGSPEAGAPGPLPPRGRAPDPRPPVPPEEPGTRGPSCFFPARAVEALLAPAAAAVLAVLGPGLANAAAAPVVGPAVERGTAARMAGRTVEHGPAARVAGSAAGRGTPAATGRGDGRGGGAKESADPRAEIPTEERAWPVAGPAGLQPTVLRGWDPPPSPWAAGHRGVDLGSSAGAAVRAAAPGKVTYAGTVAGRGVLTLEVSRSGRPPLRTTYEPVDPTVHKGQRVTAGQQVAVLQRGPFHCRAPCLHWGLRRGTTYLNPLSLLPRSMLLGGPSRLLPIFDVPVPADGGAAPGSPKSPEPAAHARPARPTPAALLSALTLAAAALWALGRLRRGRRTGR
ncbi:M23 family metallopeptidase [Streptomyces kronopolitis]|uniref:M23 family metallopeptidase n=1 Tax=Streptomyces kronopolitis TaxID=1612435 RepID=UPI003431651F